VSSWIALVSTTVVVTAAAAGYVAARPDGLLHVTVLSTGDAPAVLVRGDRGALALIDGGRSPSLLLESLGRVLGPTDHRIDLIVVTGGEEAAVAGLAGLPGHYTVGTVMASRDLNQGGLNVMTALHGSRPATMGASIDRRAGGAEVDPEDRSWEWDGAIWRCLGFFAEATGRSMCAVTVADRSGRLLVLGDVGTADQEQLCAMYGGGLHADVLVAEPGGSLSTALLGVSRPSAIAVPTVQGGFAASAPSGYSVIRTATNGDLPFSGGSRGLIETA
jgi:beta-lactamase superfamily II metal-dependent hydrolase